MVAGSNPARGARKSFSPSDFRNYPHPRQNRCLVHASTVRPGYALRATPGERAAGAHEMRIVPILLRQANDFVEAHHRHSSRTSNDGGKFAVGLMEGTVLVGVAIVGRPIARMLQLGGEYPAELLRLCTSPACPKGGGSKLYSRVKRIWQLMGGTHLHTYTLEAESRASMRGAGLRDPAAIVAPRQWDTKSRRRRDRAVAAKPKVHWTEELPEIPA